MAKVTTITPIADIRGALRRGDKVIFRVRDGIQQSYVVKHPYKGNGSDAQKAARSTFRDLTQQVKAIYADPQQLAEWQKRFDRLRASRQYRKALTNYINYIRTPQEAPYIPIPKDLRPTKPPTTLYGFILSTLSAK
ncbi:MAG: hypothetical protein IJQ95_04140 [Paludibacteraceae bacterium]|nr:hypothetical protein [Paludibacteraceae bacterium]